MIDFRDPSLLYATFDLTDQPLGDYDVRLEDTAASETLTGAFTIGEAQPDEDALQLFLLNPEFARTGRVGTVAVEYVNTGDTDITAPLLRLTATNATLRLPGQLTFIDSDLTFLGIAPDGPAGVLRPGQRGRVELEFLSTGPNGAPIDFQTFFVDPNETMDWDSIKNDFRPEHISVDAWDVVFANFLTEAGETVGEYESMLSRLATSLSMVGIRTPSTTRLLRLALEEADASYAGLNLITVDDVAHPTPGEIFRFSRYFQQPIHGRYDFGPFGRGWTHNWDVVASFLPGGDVEVRSGGVRSVYARLDDGTFARERFDGSSITVTNGIAVQTFVNGDSRHFRADGRLDSLDDSKGNRVTIDYDVDGRISSLSHSSGAVISLGYNAEGLINTLTDPVGRLITYAYDQMGEHLTSYSDRYGTHEYTYMTGDSPAREHALASVVFSDDSQFHLAYDDFGRLSQVQREGENEPLTYEYSPGGGLHNHKRRWRHNITGVRRPRFVGSGDQFVGSIDPIHLRRQPKSDPNRNARRDRVLADVRRPSQSAELHRFPWTHEPVHL